MVRSILFALLSVTAAPHLLAQWVPGDSFGSTYHHQACAFHDVDTGLFVYGTDNPNSGEGGVIITWSGLTDSGGVIWYQSFMNLEDIDVRMGSNGRPIYLAAGHQQYAFSVALHPYLAGGNPFQFDSVRTGDARHYRAIRMRSDIVAFAGGGNYVGDGIIDMSVDTGYTWTNIAVLPGQPVSRLHFVDDLLGFAATGGYRRLAAFGVNVPDSGAIYRTTDGGLNWLQVHRDTITGFSDVAFSSLTTGVATRNDGVILRTTDGGTTWVPAVVNLPAASVMTSVTFRPDGTGFASAYRADGVSGYILISTDDGQTWDENFNTSGFNHSRRIYDVYFYDDAHGYASTHIRPLRTSGLVTDVPEIVEQTLVLYPNPAIDLVQLAWELPGAATGGGRLSVVSAHGQLVSDLPIAPSTTSYTLDVSNYPPGLYHLHLVVDGQLVSAAKVVIE